MPYLIVQALIKYEKEENPFRKVHRLIDSIEVLIKIHTVIVMSRFFSISELSDTLKGLLVAGLKTPSLGIWWSFAREFAQELLKSDDKNSSLLPMLQNLGKSGQLFKSIEGKTELITFRNSYAHGSTPEDESCLQDIKKYEPILYKLCSEASYFRNINFLGKNEKGEWFKTNGAQLLKNEENLELSDECYLKLADGTFFSLYPLLLFRTENSVSHFFLYNDLRKAHVSLLNYENCLHKKEKELRGDFLLKFPIDSWKSQGITVEDKFKDRIELLTETFKGRKPELQTLLNFLNTKDGGYLMIWGGPGVGKSALLARATQMLSWSEEVREAAGISGEFNMENLHINEYFIRRDMGTNKEEDLLEYFYKRLENRFKTGINPGKNTKELRKAVNDQLRLVTQKLSEDERLVLIIDGLDEATESPELLDFLPREYIKKLLVIYASRENPIVKSIVYDKLEREKHQHLNLGSLTIKDTRALLYEYINKYELKKEYVKVLAHKSKGNPLYLKLICQGLEDKLYLLNDTVNLPDKLGEIYSKIIKRLYETEKNDNFFQVLMVMAAGKDFFSEEMLSKVLNISTMETKSALNVCLEILIENPLTEKINDYQLFHESLREYLVENYKDDLKKSENKLAEFCLNWENLERESELYSLNYLVTHLNQLYQKTKDNDTESKTEILNQMTTAVECEKFRKRIFEVCGNDISLKYGLTMIQKILAKIDQDGSSMERFFCYSKMHHEERDKMEQEQLLRIVKEAGEGNLENIANLAKMGRTTKDKLLLIVKHCGKLKV